MPVLWPQCSNCRAFLSKDELNQSEPRPCPACKTPILVDFFPAYFRPPAVGQVGERLVLEDEASCFYHPEKRAAQHCAACGRFLCSLCDCELQSQHYCPNCLETGRVKGRIRNLENQRIRYDQVALSLAILPIITVYFTLATAPLVLYLVCRHWKSPLSLVHRSRWRFVVAAIIALLQIAGWGVVMYFIVQSLRSANG